MGALTRDAYMQTALLSGVCGLCKKRKAAQDFESNAKFKTLIPLSNKLMVYETDVGFEYDF